MADRSQNADLIEAWINYHSLDMDSKDRERLFWAWEDFNATIHKNPDQALKLILEVLDRNQSPQILANLAAGPLEDLLVFHGSAIIDRVEKLARQAPMFRKLLGGVWKNDIENDVWLRLEKFRVSLGDI